MRTMDVVYLDNNATTRPAPEVVSAMLPFLTELYGNPSSVHRFGQRARHAIDEARHQLATALGCSDSELLFTGGGTESINTAIRGILASRAPRRRIVTSSVEHSAARELCGQLGKEGFEIVQVPVDQQGLLDLELLRTAVNDETALVTIMWVNNETGVIFPVQQIAQICRERRVPFHCDAVQAVGKLAVNLHESGIDAASIAAHKFHGPKGVGALFIRRGLRVRPLIIGGPQERNRRGGTENVAGIVGMGRAAELVHDALSDAPRIAAMRDRLEQATLRAIEGASVNGSRQQRVGNTTNIGFPQLEAEAILLLLSEQGICASAGAACSSGSLEPSAILRAMKIDEKLAHGSIRLSLSRYTTDAEIDRLLEVMPGVIERLRKVLPVGA
jgi:cysteine desulfurase